MTEQKDATLDALGAAVNSYAEAAHLNLRGALTNAIHSCRAHGVDVPFETFKWTPEIHGLLTTAAENLKDELLEVRLEKFTAEVYARAEKDGDSRLRVDWLQGWLDLNVNDPATAREAYLWMSKTYPQEMRDTTPNDLTDQQLLTVSAVFGVISLVGDPGVLVTEV